MTIGADCGDGQSLPEETLTMNRLGVMAEDLLLGNIVLPRYGRAFLVAGAAEHGNLEFGDSGIDCRNRKDVVFAVAVMALRSEFLPGGFAQSAVVYVTNEAGPVYSVILPPLGGRARVERDEVEPEDT